MLIEIAEKEEEEDSTGRNDGKDIFKNQSDIYFNQKKKIFLKNHKKYDNESKNNDIIINDKNNNQKENEFNKNYYKIPIYTHENRKESNIFNNYIGNIPKNILQKNNKLNTINYIDYSRNNDNISKFNKDSFNSFSNNKNNSRYNIIYRNFRINSQENNFKDIILNNKKNNDNNPKISLPNLNIGSRDNKEKKRNLSSIKKYNKNNIDKISTNNNVELKKHSSYSMNRQNYHNDIKENTENVDNMKINLLSSISKSSNILIPIISRDNKINNYNCNLKEDDDENNYEDIKKSNENIKPFNRLDNRLKKENRKNDINEIIPNKMIDLYNKNKLLKKINKKLLLENNNNLLMSLDNSFMSKLHKIKIEKGIMGIKIFESLNKNLLNQEYNVLRTSENANINNKLPLIIKH